MHSHNKEKSLSFPMTIVHEIRFIKESFLSLRLLFLRFLIFLRFLLDQKLQEYILCFHCNRGKLCMEKNVLQSDEIISEIFRS